MLIGYSSTKLQGICEEQRSARKALPKDVAELLPQRLVVLAAFRCLKDIPRGTPLHFHPLRENWAGHFAVRIDKKYRIVFKPCGEFDRLPDGDTRPGNGNRDRDHRSGGLSRWLASSRAPTSLMSRFRQGLRYWRCSPTWGLPKSGLAERMKRPANKVNEILHGKRAITTDTAMELELVLGIPSLRLARAGEQLPDRQEAYRVPRHLPRSRSTLLKKFPVRRDDRAQAGSEKAATPQRAGPYRSGLLW